MDTPALVQRSPAEARAGEQRRGQPPKTSLLGREGGYRVTLNLPRSD